MREKEYPYQNLSPKNMKGERWKDIPGFEDEYQLSNYGRLKSRDRYVDYGKYDCFRPGRIKKLHLTGSPRNKNTVDLQMQLHKDCIRYQFSVARYVYSLFVKAFDTELHSFIIARKDGDILNCYYKNLELKTISDVAKDGYANNQRKSKFQLQAKPVTQYDPNGEKMASFKDAKEAAKAAGLAPKNINDAARTKKRMCGGYYWRYGGKPKQRISVLRLNSTGQTSVGKPNLADPPYQNTSIENMRGEKWKVIKGFEGLYAISDHGRVKSLRHLKKITTAKGANTENWTRELVMKQALIKSHNHFINEPLYYLTICFKKEGTHFNFIVARLVYQAFGKVKHALTDKFIAHKDNNNLNNHISNLIPSTPSELNRNSYARNRRESHFASR